MRTLDHLDLLGFVQVVSGVHDFETNHQRCNCGDYLLTVHYLTRRFLHSQIQYHINGIPDN